MIFFFFFFFFFFVWHIYIFSLLLLVMHVRMNTRLYFVLYLRDLIHLGPVVQSVVSLSSSLRVISLTVLADSIYNILIFFAGKM